MKLNGSQILIECLKEQGVDTVFGYPGGAILNIYDELYKHSNEIRHVLTSHEQGASHAADGYARATGKVGVCLATSGPGATNLVTGIATAYMDSVPIVAITANVGTALLGRDSFQEIDISGVAMPITKHSYIVKDVSKLADTVRSAFRIAKEGRPGPVLIDITKNATADVTDYTPFKPEPVEPSDLTVRTSDLERAAKLIARAKKPFILVGGGSVISNASEEIRELANKLDAPVTDTLMGKGAFDGHDDRYTGMLGMHGTKPSNLGVTQCDLLIALGARFSDRVTGNAKKFARHARILQIDVDAAEINKNVLVDASVIGDVKEVLHRLLPMIEQQTHTEWINHIRKLKERYPLKYETDKLTGPFVVEQIYKETKGDAIIVTEVGQHQMWAAQYYKYSRPHQLLTSGGLGTMGYGLGAAIEVVVNNHVLGMVRQWQTLFYGERYAHTTFTDGVDFVKVAQALGAEGFRVEKPEDFVPTLRKAIEMKRPVLIDCIIDQDDKVFQMVAAGHSIEEVFDQEDLERE